MREMKNSNVPWLGDIPRSWKIERCKYNFDYHKDVAGKESVNYERLALTLKGVVKRAKDDAEGLQPKDFDGYQIAHKDDLIFKLIDLDGKSTSRVGLSDYEGLVSPAYILLHSKESEINKKFAEYYFLSMWHRYIFNEIGNGGIRSSLNAKDLLEVPIAKTSLKEQDAIVKYLDDRCSKIDEAISRNNQIIEKLEEYRKAVITQAVTKGLDSNVEMKDSGEKWIGKMPVNWGKSKFKFANTLKRIKATNKSNYIGLENIESFTGKKVGDTTTPEGDAIIFEKGDVLFGKLRPYLSKSLAVSESGCCSGEIIVLKPRLTSQQYLLYLTLSQDFVKRVDDSTYGTKMPRASWEFIGNLLMPVPNVKQQEKIVIYLDKICSQIDESVQRQKDIVAKLEEYKKSLIYNAVTGKIEV